MLLVFAFIPFSVYGQDGYLHWFPVIAEYIRGADNFAGSTVIFNGQNLRSLYGELPFWKVLRVLSPSIEQFLNITHAVFVLFFFYFSRSLARGMSERKISLSDDIVLLAFAVLGPVIVNRVMSGHINLLFGCLPFFIFSALIFNKSYLYIFISFFALWCAWSTHAFQLLAYHVFYIPLLAWLFVRYEKQKTKYLFIAFGIFALSFAVNYPLFREMLNQALSPDSVRPLDVKMTYSYIVSTFHDIVYFFVSAKYEQIMIRPEGFYHEVSYPFGAFFLMMFIFKKERKFIAFLLGLLLVFFLFCMDAPVANLLSDLPGIKSFRVPQRIFIILSLFIPLWVFSKKVISLNVKELAIFFVLTLMAQFLIGYEVIAIALMLALYFRDSIKHESLIYALAFSGLFSGGWDKISDSRVAFSEYEQVREMLLPLTNKYSVQELKQKKFQFQSAAPLLVNFVAQTMGFPTLEGYGYPPPALMKKFESVFEISLSGSQVIIIPQEFSTDTEKLKSYGITTIVRFNANNELSIQEI